MVNDESSLTILQTTGNRQPPWTLTVLVTVPTNMPTTMPTTRPSTKLTYISSTRTSTAPSTVPKYMASSRQIIEPPAEPTNMSSTRPTILLHESTVPSHQLRYPLQFYLLSQLMCQLLCWLLTPPSTVTLMIPMIWWHYGFQPLQYLSLWVPTPLRYLQYARETSYHTEALLTTTCTRNQLPYWSVANYKHPKPVTILKHC